MAIWDGTFEEWEEICNLEDTDNGLSKDRDDFDDEYVSDDWLKPITI